MLMRPADRQITVGQTGCAHEAGLLAFTAASMEPNAFIAAEGAQAEFATHRQMSRMDLVARKHDACKLDPERLGCGTRGRKISAKGIHSAALFQAIEMREGVCADFLGRVVEDLPDQR